MNLNNIKETFYHFSVDDVFDSLIEITDRKIKFFEHPFFSFLKELHDEFGTKIDLYLFFQKNINGRLRTLKEIPGNIKEVLDDNPWIRFAPHGLDYNTPPYSQSPEEQIKVFDKIYKEIYHFAGKENLSRWVRLHYFSESYELRDYFHKHGVEALFTTDKDRITTKMSQAVNESLRTTGFSEYNGIKLIRSHIRTENLANEGVKKEDLEELVKNYIGKYSHLCFFSHESELVYEDVKLITKELIKELYKQKIPSY